MISKEDRELILELVEWRKLFIRDRNWSQMDKVTEQIAAILDKEYNK